MSCVALAKPISMNTANVSCTHHDVGIVNAIPARAIATIHCMMITHQRLDLMMSTKGLQKGLITHGSPSHPV